MSFGMQMKRTATYLTIALIVVVIVTVVILIQRDRKADINYQMAISREPAVDAIKELAMLHSAKSNRLLLSIALDQRTMPDNRIAAIKSLPGSDVSHLSSLIQPHSSLALRRVVAERLLETRCGVDCASNILAYMNRIQAGEQTVDSFLSATYPTPDTSSNEDLQVAVAHLNSVLANVLRKNESETVSALEQRFGLGSTFPSPFALTIVQSLRLAGACDPLLRTKSMQTKVSPLLGRISEVQGDVGCVRQKSH